MMRVRILAVAVVTAASMVLIGGAAEFRDGYRVAVPPYRFSFPRDHASHPEFRIEWWYYTGIVQAASSRRSYGFELTFFRVGIDRAREQSRSAWAPSTLFLAHAALTDVDRKTFRFDEQVSRPALGIAGADTTRLHVWVEGWSAEQSPDGRTQRLRAETGEFGMDLTLQPVGVPVINGENGLSLKGAERGQASHYYSIPRLRTAGTIRAGADTFRVAGDTWMDHEFTSSGLAADEVGWDWFGLRLQDGGALMLYQLRRKDGGVVPQSSGTLVGPDGRARHLNAGDFRLSPTGRWKSSRSGAVYPHGWIVRIPSEDLELRVEPLVDDQELVTRSTGGVTYWEGAARARGTRRG